MDETPAKPRKGAPPRYDLIPPSSLRRLAMIYSEGAESYGPHNWLKGYEYGDVLNHAIEHLNRYLQGDKSEDQLAKVAWACFTMMFYDDWMPGRFDNIKWSEFQGRAINDPDDL